MTEKTRKATTKRHPFRVVDPDRIKPRNISFRAQPGFVGRLLWLAQKLGDRSMGETCRVAIDRLYLQMEGPQHDPRAAEFKAISDDRTHLSVYLTPEVNRQLEYVEKTTKSDTRSAAIRYCVARAAADLMAADAEIEALKFQMKYKTKAQADAAEKAAFHAEQMRDDARYDDLRMEKIRHDAKAQLAELLQRSKEAQVLELDDE